MTTGPVLAAILAAVAIGAGLCYGHRGHSGWKRRGPFKPAVTMWMARHKFLALPLFPSEGNP